MAEVVVGLVGEVLEGLLEHGFWLAANATYQSAARVIPSPPPVPDETRQLWPMWMALGLLVVVIAGRGFRVPAAVALIALLAIHAQSAFVQIGEGSVGLVFTAGVLSDSVLQPGIHAVVPIVQRVTPIPVTVQTRRLTDVKCGTSSGVDLVFPLVEVVYSTDRQRLVPLIRTLGLSFAFQAVEENLRNEVTQTCSEMDLASVYVTAFDTLNERFEAALNKQLDQWTGGVLKAIDVRVSKPKLPDGLSAAFRTIEELRAKVRVEDERRATRLREAQTLHKQAVSDAERATEVARITAQRRIDGAQTRATMSIRSAEMLASEIVARANASWYAASQRAATERVKLTPEYLAYLRATLLLQNTRMFLGGATPMSVFEEPDDGRPVSAATAHAVPVKKS